MKKIGLFFLAIMLGCGFSSAKALAHWHGYHGGWCGPRFYWGGPIVVGPIWGFPYGYYPPPPRIIHEPPIVVQPQNPETNVYYWYYCEDPKGYYPYISSCPGGWMKVIPNVPQQPVPDK